MNFHTLKFRFILLAALVVVISVALRFAVILPFVQEQLHGVATAQQRSIASYVAADVEHSVTMRDALLRELAAGLPPALLANPQALADWIDERRLANPHFSRGLLVIRPDGKGLFAHTTAMSAYAALRFHEEDWFQAALAAQPKIAAKPLREPGSGEPVLLLAAPVRDAGQKIVAVIAGVAVLNADDFLKRLQANKFGDTGGFLLISPTDKLFVGASDPAMIFQPTPPSGKNLLHDRAMAGFRGTEITVNAKGVQELSTMVSVPSAGWFLVARMPTEEVFGPIASLRVFALNSGILTLIVVMSILMVILPRILRPLTDAAAAMREIADGRRALLPLPLLRNDEVGSLVRGFNYLVGRLHEKEAALIASEARMEYMAHHDSLTGLYNRPMLEERLQQALAHAGRNGAHFALLFCDLDHFKPINDVHGHAMGDAVLMQVAERFSEGRRKVDTVARLGGDEFVILLAELDDARVAAEAIARHYLESIGRPYHVAEQTFTLRVSIGISLYQGGVLSSSQMLLLADTAMYQAKRSGKNQFCFAAQD